MKKLLFTVLVSATTFAFAQSMRVESGDFKFLKGQKEFNVKFDFKDATFYKEKMDEEDFINKRVGEISKDKGEAEAGRWLKDWEYSKKESFQDKFLASLNKGGDRKGKAGSSAPYTLIVKTVWIYPGWFAGVMNQPAKVSTDLVFVEAKNPKNVLLTISSENAPGDGGFIGVANNNDRIAEGYAKTGKSLAKMIAKGAKK